MRTPSKICNTCSTQLSELMESCPNCKSFTDLNHPLEFKNEQSDTVSFPFDAFAKIFEIENTHFWFSFRNAVIAHVLKKYFISANTFLEIGCGTGYGLSYLSKRFPE